MTVADWAALDDLWNELHKGKVYEVSLRADKEQVYGLQEGDSIYIDPRPAVLEYVVHELLHRRFPTYSERTVTRRARALVVKMDEPTKARWWKAYQRIKRKGRPVEADE